MKIPNGWKMLNKPGHVIPQMKPVYSLNTIWYCFWSITSKSLVISRQTQSPERPELTNKSKRASSFDYVSISGNLANVPNSGHVRSDPVDRNSRIPRFSVDLALKLLHCLLSDPIPTQWIQSLTVDNRKDGWKALNLGKSWAIRQDCKTTLHSSILK